MHAKPIDAASMDAGTLHVMPIPGAPLIAAPNPAALMSALRFTAAPTAHGTPHRG
jgi:hypothetical protein